MNRQSNQKITALYCRIARIDRRGFFIAMNQQRELLQYAKDHGLDNPEIFCDFGFSGSTFERPEFQKVLREIKVGNVSNLVIKDLSRLSRNCFDCAELVGETLPLYGVTFHTVQDGIGISEYLKTCGQVHKALSAAHLQKRNRGRV